MKNLYFQDFITTCDMICVVICLSRPVFLPFLGPRVKNAKHKESVYQQYMKCLESTPHTPGRANRR